MTYAERNRFGVAALLEHRVDRGYDNVSNLVHPNGTIVAAQQPDLSKAFLVAVVDLYHQQGAKVA